MAQDYRAAGRTVGVTVRMSQEDREHLETQMRDEGYTSLQQLFEARVFGEARPRRRSGRQQQTERLDISA